jgi:hypothetical protein
MDSPQHVVSLCFLERMLDLQQREWHMGKICSIDHFALSHLIRFPPMDLSAEITSLIIYGMHINMLLCSLF